MPIMMRPESGTKTRAASQQDVYKYIHELQQELSRSRGETQRARDKLNCLISLVRRSWNGDRNASIHLANIIGLDIPPFLQDSGTAGRPSTSMQGPMISAKTPAVVNWERLAVKLLQRDCDLMQQEIREQQRRYIQNRSQYMDEVMHSHHLDMAHLPLSRPASGKLSSVDQHFLQLHSVVKPDGLNEARQRLNRPKSSALRTKAKMEREVVQQAEVKLRDLFVDPSNPCAFGSAMPSSSDASSSGGGSRETQPARQRRRRQDYDDSRRYVQGQLFQAEEMLGRRTRPMSAVIQREKDRMRARPRSAVITTENSEGSSDRPLKYETTRPVSSKKAHSSNQRRASASDAQSTNNNNNVPHTTTTSDDDNAAHHPNTSFTELVLQEEEEEGEAAEPVSQPPISVRVKSAITRPESVDKFSQDLRHMEEMEALFKMNTLALQKKLGLPENGMV